MGDVNHEPTMEEILASIKKIIAEDGETAVSEHDARSRRRQAQTAEPEPRPVHAAADDILELTDQCEPEPAPRGDSEDEAEPLAADETVKASQAALAALSAIANPASNVGGSDEAHPLEGLVREMLRPLLKDWIDENLPALVEEMVAREIARIAASRG